MEATMSDRDRNFILNPNDWPHLILPLKRKNPFQDGNMAVFAPPISKGSIPEDAPIEILIGTMFDKLSELPRKQYENVDALLADGWKVD
jgi:hypothetical protein